jgi:hypothetical protein
MYDDHASSVVVVVVVYSTGLGLGLCLLVSTALVTIDRLFFLWCKIR